jgi:mono/diheme cytochrome c family protein
MPRHLPGPTSHQMKQALHGLRRCLRPAGRGKKALLLATSFVLLLVTLSLTAGAPQSPDTTLERQFTSTVRPFIATHCAACHSGAKPQADLDLTTYTSLADVVRDHARWEQVREKLATETMPPPAVKQQPTPETRQAIVAWIEAMRKEEARKHAGDPGIVLARRLSNAEYNYTVRDLTGADIRPAREFPVDPANQAGFDNSGESLSMSPALLTKYLQAAQFVANHLVLQPSGFTFAPHPMLVETDRDRYAVKRIIDLYEAQSTDYSDYFVAAWRYKHRATLGKPTATLANMAVEMSAGASRTVSAKYLATVWRALEATPEQAGPLAELQAMWKALPVPGGKHVEAARAGADRMRDFIAERRLALVPKVTTPSVKGISATAQPFLMSRNRQYATQRMTCEGDAATTRFCAIFPDAFYISERGRYFPDNTRDKGRHLSAGFHNLMGYFRDDAPLYELILDVKGQKQLDSLWQELDFVASANIRTHVQFFFNESGEARGLSRESEGPRPADSEVTSEAAIRDVAEAYLTKARASGNETAVKAIDEHFRSVNAGIRWVEKARVDAEPSHLVALEAFTQRAYRRPLTQAERADVRAHYTSLRETAGLDHTRGSQASASLLSDYALASRLSYFLWSSMPDAELLARAAAGDLRRPEGLAIQARRMLKDDRVRGLVTEFGGNWLDFRRFEEHNAVDRERFSAFTNDLRQAMFEEPVRFMLDVIQENRPVLDFVYATRTFVNPVLAKHYGMPDVSGGPDTWVRIDDADRYGRGGLLPMSVFLTKNAPGLRTSPVKRGYWVVKQVLGEHIPPPPAAVPELPRDEAKLDLPLRDMLARHREDKMCASCHSRFDALGLVFEGYGPVGEARTQDLSGRPVDASATFPGGSTGAGLEGLRAYVKGHRQDDFIDNLSRKLLAYALGRSLILSDDLTIDAMRAKLARDGYRFQSLIESIVTSQQFRMKRGEESQSVVNQDSAKRGMR